MYLTYQPTVVSMADRPTQREEEVLWLLAKRLYETLERLDPDWISILEKSDGRRTVILSCKH
jgi:hypothetical protein